MDKLLMNYNVRKIDPKALYVLIDSPTGILLEDFVPLLTALEKAYRKLLIHRLDNELRELLETRQKEGALLNGISRSINAKYKKIMGPKDSEYLYHKDRSLLDHADYSITRKYKYDYDYELIEREALPPSKKYIPHRIQITRAHVDSPGFLEIFGDPTTLTILGGFLASLITIRHQDRQHQLALRQDQRDNVELLTKLGYSREDISSVSSYLNKDLTEILEHLNFSKARLAPGKDIDPSLDLLPDATDKKGNGKTLPW